MDAEWAARDGVTDKLDPAFEAHAAPLVTFAEAWWSSWRSYHDLRSAHEATWLLINRRDSSPAAPDRSLLALMPPPSCLLAGSDGPSRLPTSWSLTLASAWSLVLILLRKCA